MAEIPEHTLYLRTTAESRASRVASPEMDLSSDRGYSISSSIQAVDPSIG
jgi:hypothetical protein